MKRTALALVGAYWVALILACGGPPARGTAPSASARGRSRQEVWSACQRPIQQARCGTDLITGTVCMRQIGDEYFGQASDADAQLVLIRAGCPEGMVR